ncbi:hypothetical protein DPMN_005084 [Dreissena polymorpha]|uniref:Uncharacterized protein n=1 Tax=Dreissena polymorpha TaxID=45954 RepID=A0A9D4RTK0_DREPO|nr:hypothetical protein DPMN_005084 [Dreissena polymorpha]
MWRGSYTRKEPPHTTQRCGEAAIQGKNLRTRLKDVERQLYKVRTSAHDSKIWRGSYTRSP